MSTTIELDVRQEHVQQSKDTLAVSQPASQLGLAADASSVEPFGPGPDANIARVQQRWNDGINKYRLAATFISFAVVGASDGVYGALVPSLRDDYHVSTTVVSLIFVTPFVGYTAATALVNKMHMSFGQRGIAVVGPLCHLVPFIVMAIRPPWPVMLVAYIIVGLGNGLVDAAWNSWVADMVNANTWMGILAAFYGLGATLSPLIATNMIHKGIHWNYFYWTLAAGSAIELATSTAAFWKEDAAQYRLNNKKSSDAGEGSRTTQAAKSRVTWIMSIFLFTYMGVEVSIGGWIVDFMMKERHGGAYESGLIPTGFWAGVTVGRLVLGVVNDWLGERLAVTIYLGLSIALELVFWLVPRFVVSAVAVALLGVFTGPLFPAAIVVAAKLLPKHLHTPGIGIASAFAGSGAAILPFVAGAISGAKGVQTLQPFILALLVTITVMWMLLPRQKHNTQ